MSLTSFGRAKEQTTFAADNSPHSPSSAAAAAHRLCRAFPARRHLGLAVAPSNNVLANRVLQQTNQAARALHVWAAHQLETPGLPTSCCSGSKCYGVNPSGMSSACLPLQMLPRHSRAATQPQLRSMAGRNPNRRHWKFNRQLRKKQLRREGHSQLSPAASSFLRLK